MKQKLWMICLFLGACKPNKVKNNVDMLPFLGKTTYISSKNGQKTDTLHQTIPFYELIDQNGQVFRSKDWNDNLYLAHFFFTTCPSVCPKTQPLLQKIAMRFRQTNDFKIISYSIDPQYDTPKRLKSFAQQNGFNTPNHIFLTGNKDTIYRLANEHYNTTTIQGIGAKNIIHNGALILIDKEKHIRGMYDGLDISEFERLEKDVQNLLRTYLN
jgi:protein SCO1